jgi:hypothetical protein
MRIVADRPWHRSSSDDYYRVKAKWVGNDLYWVVPFGDGGYSDLATFKDGTFQLQYDKEGPLWVFQKVDGSKLDDNEKPLAMDREPYDYVKEFQPAPVTGDTKKAPYP